MSMTMGLLFTVEARGGNLQKEMDLPRVFR